MNRRRWLQGLAATTLAAGAGVTMAVRMRSHPYFTSLDQVETWLAEHAPSDLTSNGSWSVAQIFSHCAQSLEFTLTGFPELKPAWFRNTVGPLAFAVFSGLGGTKHGLAQAIPGTRVDDLQTDPVAAHQQLRSAIDRFRRADHLEPHFAYGPLTPAQLDRAHAMHVSEHLVEILVGRP